MSVIWGYFCHNVKPLKGSRWTWEYAWYKSNVKQQQNSKNVAARLHITKDLCTSDDHKEGELQTHVTAAPTLDISVVLSAGVNKNALLLFEKKSSRLYFKWAQYLCWRHIDFYLARVPAITNPAIWIVQLVLFC